MTQHAPSTRLYRRLRAFMLRDCLELRAKMARGTISPSLWRSCLKRAQEQMAYARKDYALCQPVTRNQTVQEPMRSILNVISGGLA